MIKLIQTLILAVSIFALQNVQAKLIDIDFSDYAGGSEMTYVDGISFELLGAPDSSGSPTISNYSGIYGGLLTNSRYGGDYPTANILQFTFDSVASGISFVFNNAGFSSSGRGASFYEAFDSSGNLLESGSITGASLDTFTVAASGVQVLQFNNNTNGASSWWFGVRSITAEIPVPATLVLFALGFAGFLRRK